MSRQRMIVTDDQLLIDMELLFNAIREVDGDWEQVEKDMNMYIDSVRAMTGASENLTTEEMIDTPEEIVVADKKVISKSK